MVSGREAAEGEALPAVLVTRHLQFSLPYRALFSTTLRPDTAKRLLDALAVLMVRLHLVGFSWGVDPSQQECRERARALSLFFSGYAYG